MATIGVILSGCGVFDGSEIHEAVAVLYALDQRGATYQCMAPDKPLDEINHLTKQPTGQQRNVLTEAARIARGDILSLADVKGNQYDAFVLPGGFGAAKNLCTFAATGSNCTVDQHTARVLNEAHAAGKPLGFACIAPAVAAKVFGQSLHPTLTIGHDKSTAQGLESLGARHQVCDVHDVIVDKQNRIVTTPAYMEANRITEVFTGIGKMVDEVLKMIG